jgi:hypothetical protein
MGGPLQGRILLCAVGLTMSVLPVAALSQGASAAPPTLSPPTILEGSLSVSQSHFPSQFEEGTFDHYEATATFSNLTFGKGSEGPYTLLHGNVTYSGLTLTQSAPGLGGPCDATYQFSVDQSKPLFGDLSFSETGGQAHVALQLGLDTTGVITTASDCGSDNQFTSNVFGKPPRIDFPFSAEGDWDQSTGTATFDDVNKHAYLGGTETDVVRGKLDGGLEIYVLQNGKERANVTDATTEVAVGQPIRLEAEFADKSTPKLTGKGWTGITSTTAVQNYDFYDSFARTTPLDEGNLMSPKISFYWVKAPDEATEGGSYTIDVTAKNQKSGEEETAETTFHVQGPHVDAFGAVTCGAGVNRTVSDPKNHMNPPELSLGFNDTAPGCHGVPGVTWSIDITAPSISGGRFAMTQLVAETLTHDGTTCTEGGFLMNGRTVADGGRSYGQTGDPIGPIGHPVGANAQWKPEHPPLNDSPSVGLREGGTWVKTDTFTDYLMFQPDAAGSIWVALAQMGPWSWSGTAKIAGGVAARWVLSAYQNPNKILSAAQTSALPEWNGAIGLFPLISKC